MSIYRDAFIGCPERAVTTNEDSCVDLLLRQWFRGGNFPRIQACLRYVLGELDIWAQFLLLNEPRLEVMMWSEAPSSVRAYFPIHRRRIIAKQFKLKSTTRVLLVLSAKRFDEQPLDHSIAALRQHLGHTLLYLRNPRASNKHVDAEKEWRSALKLDRTRMGEGQSRRLPKRDTA